MTTNQSDSSFFSSLSSSGSGGATYLESYPNTISVQCRLGVFLFRFREVVG